MQADDGRTSHLTELLRSMGNGPVLFLPLFTRCSSSCPTLLHRLEESLAFDASASRVRVFMFSFDPTETPATLFAFRSTSRIPGDWRLARADQAATRVLLQYLNYPVMSRGSVFIHPSEIFVLDDALRWRWTLGGIDWSSKDLSEVIERSGSPNFVSRIEGRPEAIAWMALALTIGSIFLTIAFWSRHLAARKRSVRSPGLRQPF